MTLDPSVLNHTAVAQVFTVLVPVTKEAHPRLWMLVHRLSKSTGYGDPPVGRLPGEKKRRRKHRI